MSLPDLFTPIIAQSDPQRTTSSGVPTNNEANKPVWYFDDMGLVAGIALAIMVVLAVIAAFIKKKGSATTGSRAFRHIPDARNMDKNSPNGDHSRRKKRRRRKRDHRPRNPSLSETGGYPHSDNTE
jgi:hypothetical protein